MRSVIVLLLAASATGLRLPAATGAVSRRALAFGAAAALVTPRAAPAKETLPPAAVMLRVAEVTDYQEAMLRKSARETQEERQRDGLELARTQMELSTDVLLKNTKLASLPGCVQPALTLGGVKRIAQSGEGALTEGELLLMAGAYALARSELRVAFEALPPEEQQAAKDIVRKLRAEDDERKRQAQDEALKEALYGYR